MSSTEKAFSEAIAPYLNNNSKVLVAFSGGCDSLALLALCAYELGQGRVVPVYVDHNLRQRAELDAEISLNSENCKALGLDLVVRTVDEGRVRSLAELRKGGLEDAARAIRYEILEEERLSRGCDLILTAHHRQDQIETVVMHLQSGSPITSLKGIASYDPNRRILRPLLKIGRPELESYLAAKGLAWSTDSTNEDQSFRRNRVRHSIVPALERSWPGFDDQLLHLGRMAQRLCAEATAKADLEAKSDISLDRIRSMDVISRTLTLFSMWDRSFPERSLPMTCLDRVIDAITRGEDCIVGSNMAVFCIYHGRLYLIDPKEDEVYSQFERSFDPSAAQNVNLLGDMKLLTGSEASSHIRGLGLDEGLALHLDPARFNGFPRVRFARRGDSVMLKDGSKMVLRLLQDMGVPAKLRSRVPVIVDNDGVCAVFGTVFGGRDRICVKFRTSLAPNSFPLYIVSKG